MKIKKILALVLMISMLLGIFSIYPMASETVPVDAAEFNGHFYKIYDSSITWTKAKEECESLGGHLVTITSQAEQDFITEYIKSSTRSFLWMGGYKENGKLAWITGESMFFENWEQGEPNNQYEKASMLYTHNTTYPPGTWNDAFTDANTNRKYKGKFGYICEWSEKSDIVLQRKQKNYIQHHIDFINSGTYKLATTDYRNASIMWENQFNSNGYQEAAQYVYDILEGTVSVISFEEIPALTNPYDAIMLDLLSSDQTDKFFSETAEAQAMSITNEIIQDVITTFNADETWEDIDAWSEIEELFTGGKSNYSSNAFYKMLSKLLENKSWADVDSLFKSFDVIDEIASSLDAGLSAADYFLEIMRYKVSIEAYINTSNEFKQIIRDVADMMPYVNGEYGSKFYSTYMNYASCLNPENITKNILDHSWESGFWLTGNLLQDILQKAAISYCKVALNMTEAAAGQLAATLWATKAGFGLSNMITSNDELVSCRRLLKANYYFEEAVYRVLENHASVLKRTREYSDAVLFDAAFNLFKNIQLYSLDLHQKYMKANGSSILYFILGQQDKFNNEAEAKAEIISTWKNIKCHNEARLNSIVYSKTEFLKTNTFVVACPTNVYVYSKEDYSLVASVVNNEIYCIDDSITVIVENEDKAFCFTDFDKYDINVEAFDDGEMSLSLTQTLNSDILSKTYYKNIAIFKDEIHNLNNESASLISLGKEEIEDFAFESNYYVSEIVCPDSITRIGNFAFYDCTNLKNVLLSKNVISIGDFAFNNCIGLEKIIIPNSVISIGDCAFDSCDDLTIYCNIGNISEILESKGYVYKCLGDFDDDKMLSSIDAVLMRKSILGLSDIQDNEIIGDINQDGNVNVLDLIRLKRKMAGIVI